VNNVYLSSEENRCPTEVREARRLLSDEERGAMEASVASDPLAFPVIRGTGGFRKARWSLGTSGKSGGVRAIFYYFVSGDTVFFTVALCKERIGEFES
jgi:hypothetical protein